MSQPTLNLLLADDDADDCIFFKEALEDLPVSTNLTTVNDGVQLMQLLSVEEKTLPDALYLDLNMPRKSGFECLTEIKQNQNLKQLPVIIFSTSFDAEVVNLLHERGATYYIRKPAEFFNLKKILLKSINLISNVGDEQPLKEEFVLTPV
jgi:CheY-like chemotaxis protein